MSQFDETTDARGKEIYEDSYSKRGAFCSGRNSTKDSLQILAWAVEEKPCNCVDSGMAPRMIKCQRCHDISQVKANGDWPLDSGEEEKRDPGVQLEREAIKRKLQKAREFNLSSRIRAHSEAAPWVCDAIKTIETILDEILESI